MLNIKLKGFYGLVYALFHESGLLQYYIEPSTLERFRSMIEVEAYLKRGMKPKDRNGESKFF